MTSARRTEIAAWLDAAADHYAHGRLDEAARLYRRAEAGADPADVRATYSLAVIDIRQSRLKPARRRLRDVLARDPGLAPAWQNMGAVCEDLNLPAEAAEAYRRALALKTDAADARFGLARMLAVLGRTAEAAQAYRVLAADPAQRSRALTRLAILDPGALNDADADQLCRAAADTSGGVETQTGALFALGDVLDRRGAEGEAFAAYAAGNRLKHETLAAGPPATRPDAVARAHEAAVQFVVSRFTSEFLGRHAGGGVASAAPIFIVGMPRSGSSLIEQILASHHRVRGLGESAALSNLTDQGFPGASGVGDRTAGWRRLADAYLAAQAARGWTGAGRFVDKTLENHLRVGLIHLMFPRAVILHSVRDPVDIGLACFRQLFASGAETLYDLRQIGEAYLRYRTVMDHWDAVLPGRVIAVDHEALVADPEGRIRWLVTEACGLDWDPNCLRFHDAAGAVATASAAQVRQPIFGGSVGRWRRYADHLQPLFEALGAGQPRA